MRNWSLGKKLFSTFGVMGVVMAAIAGAGITSASRLNANVVEITEVTAEVLYLGGQVQYYVSDLRAAARMMIVAAAQGDARMVADKARENEEQYQHLIETVDKLAATTGVQEIKDLAGQVKTTMAAWHTEVADVERQASALKVTEAAAANNKAAPLGSKAEALTADIVTRQRARLAEVKKASAASYQQVTLLLTFLSLVAVAVVAVAVWVVRNTTSVLRESVGELSEGAQQVSSASGQVAGAAQSLSQGSTEQAASLEETSASMEEMASMTRKNAENSSQAASMMAETERLVHGANDALANMVSSMTAIKESSDKVAKIIKTIDEIAFQTNILALNAAVEAARAGEAGMGFAVVADEVRALAQRSAQAAKDTATLIEESIERSNEGQHKVQQVSGVIESITTSTVKVKGLVDEVSEASRQQSQGIDQVSQAIAQMEKVTQGTAATAEESAAASEELSAQAETSMNVVTRLSALVSGASASSTLAVTRTQKATRPPARVVSMPKAVKPARTEKLSAEEQIPMGDTGTFGSF